MRIKLNITKNVYENAAVYYDKAKEACVKIKGVEIAINETKKEMEKAKKEQTILEKERIKQTKIARKQAWYEKFHYFFTSNGKLVIGGKSADQNDFIYNTYFGENDLFFHADIQGGTICILKEGANADNKEMLEVAQFAASFSNAWKNGNAAVDVYCVKKDQVSKHAIRGFIAKGAYAIIGERKWFRKTPLGLKIGIENQCDRRDLTVSRQSRSHLITTSQTVTAASYEVSNSQFVNEIAIILPANCERKINKELYIIPGTHEKGKIVKRISKLLSAHPDDVQNILPSGRISLKN